MPYDSFDAGSWPYGPTLGRLVLAIALGIFVGLERERRGKEAGIRTFGFVSLLGCLGSLMGEAYALLALGLVGILIFFLNWQRLRTNDTSELTTSAALLTVGFVGALCGRGHTFTPVAVGVGAASLLAWKEKLATFSVGLTESELRSAILLAILAFIVYPVLPAQPLDPWGLIEPRAAWATVILIAAVGFGNYILYKLYGTKGILLSAFLGGLVNSTVAVTELCAQVRESGEGMTETAYRGIIAANGAMLLRNGVLAAILAVAILPYVAAPIGVMLAVSLGALWLRMRGKRDEANIVPGLTLRSPFSLAGALKFGLVFVTLDVAGALAQRYAGQYGFYFVSAVGGLVSSASAVASAANLATHGHLRNDIAANGAVIAVIASTLVNVPLVARIAKTQALSGRTIRFVAALTLVGVAMIIGQSLLFRV